VRKGESEIKKEAKTRKRNVENSTGSLGNHFFEKQGKSTHGISRIIIRTILIRQIREHFVKSRIKFLIGDIHFAGPIVALEERPKRGSNEGAVGETTGQELAGLAVGVLPDHGEDGVMQIFVFVALVGDGRGQGLVVRGSGDGLEVQDSLKMVIPV
jgi:hypothetical protein